MYSFMYVCICIVELSMPRIRGTSSPFLNTEKDDDDLEMFDQCPKNYQEHQHFDK